MVASSLDGSELSVASALQTRPSPPPSPEEQLLDPACSYASSLLGSRGLRELLQKLVEPRETVGTVQNKCSSHVICASALGDVYVPGHLVSSLQTAVAESLFLRVLPLQGNKMQWRAISAAHHMVVDEWKRVEGARRPRKSRTSGQCRGAQHARAEAAWHCSSW